MSSELQFNPFDTVDDLQARSWITSLVLRGTGLDIGPLHRPMPVPPHVHVRYVDRLTKAELLAHYPELSHLPITEPDILDNGESLGTIGDASQDFVIASHFIEHTQDPIGTMKTFCRVVKSGGTILLVVPERRAHFDRNRPLTSLEHLIQDHELGPQYTVRSHYVEYAELVDNASGDDAFAHAAALKARNYSIHFHVWTGETFLEHFSAAKKRFGLPMELVAAIRRQPELIALFQRI